jgi:signal transduction histidine kinase
MTSEARAHRPAASPAPAGAVRRDPAAADAAGWITVVSATAAPRRERDRPPSLRRLIVQMVIAAAAVALLVALAGSALSRRIAESQAVHEVAQTTDILAESVVQPSLTDAMATSTVAAGTLDDTIRSRVLSGSVTRVKLWSSDGTILYSDEARLIGQKFGLDDGAREALGSPQTRAEISDLTRPENSLERSQGKLLEVYRPVWTPAGHELLFETYFRYDAVTDRSGQLWRGFAGITLSTVAIIFLLLVPIMWALLRRARSAQAQHAMMIQRALDASQDERQRIAAALHDGIVQEVAAASFAVSAGAEAAAAQGQTQLAEHLRDAATTVRTSMGGLRSLVVDIYPPSLQSAGLAAAMRDVVATLVERGAAIELAVDDAAAGALTAEQQQAIFRLAQECLRNVVKHAHASETAVCLTSDETGVTLEVADNGRGFDPTVRRAQHLGLSLMTDVAVSVGARLELRTSPGNGTTWRMHVPVAVTA